MSQLTKIETSKDGVMYFVHPQTGKTLVNMRSLINFLAPEKFHNRINIMLSNSWNMFDQCGRLKNFEESEKLRFHCPVACRNIRATKWGDTEGAIRFVKTIHMYLHKTVTDAVWTIKSFKHDVNTVHAATVNWPSVRVNETAPILPTKLTDVSVVSNTLKMRIDCLEYELKTHKDTISALRVKAVGDDLEVKKSAKDLAKAQCRIEELELQVANLTNTALTSTHGNVFFNDEAFLLACDDVGISREYASKHLMSEACSVVSQSIMTAAQIHTSNSGFRTTGAECLNSWGLRRLKELDLKKVAVNVYTDHQKKKLNKNF